MSILSKARAAMALAGGALVVVAVAGPAAAAGTGVITAGTITIDSQAIDPPVVVDLSSDDGPCDAGDATLTISATSAGSDNYNTHIDNASFPLSGATVNSSDYVLDLSYLEDPVNFPGYDNDGFLDNGATVDNNYDLVDQHLSVLGNVYDDEGDCTPGDLQCEFIMTFEVDGSYSGTAPSLVGSATGVSGSTFQSSTGATCDPPFDSVFSTGTITLTNLSISIT